MSDLSEVAKIVRGAGGGKGGGGGRQAVEAPDSLRSKQYATVIDLISEGEIGGLVDGLKSVFLDDTPIENPGGSLNFQDVSYYWSAGAQTLTPGAGGAAGYFPSSGVKSTVAVAVKVTHATPVVRTITNSETDWIEVTVGVPVLSLQDKTNGDVHGNIVGLAIDLQTEGGGFVEVVNDFIRGKTSSRYQRTYRIKVATDGPWDVRVRRLSADDPDSASQSQLFWDLYSVAVDVKLSYPNSAALMLSLDAQNFRSVPKRGYEIYGLLVRVPTNYNPVTRVYTGAWDGTFKIAWTDNPAWCFYDLVTSTRYGLGEFISAEQVDKWGLYAVGRYCDELVPDGYGEMEPRFTCNLYLQSRDDAFKVVSSMASIFRGMAYWGGGQINVSQDAPTTPDALFNAANVINGLFTYHGADRRARHTVALVAWNDPADMYRQKLEYVQDDVGIARWGVIETEILAVGCTSRGQAHRVGKWLLYTELNESETIVFKAGLDAARVAPGSVIEVQDAVRSGKRHGGRLKTATLSALTLDAPITILDGQVYNVSVMLPSGVVTSRLVTNAPGETDVLFLATLLEDVPLDAGIWVLTVDNLQTELWRVVNVSEGDPGQVEITALYYHPGKFAAVEQGITLEPILSSSIPTRPTQVTDIQVKTELFQLNDGTTSARIAVSWSAPPTAIEYQVIWRRENDNASSVVTSNPGVDIDNVAAGMYSIKITPRNALGAAGESVTVEHEVTDSGIAPDIQNIALNPGFLGRDMPIKFDAIPGTTGYLIEVRDGVTNSLLRQETVTQPEFVYTYAKNLLDGGPRRSLKVRIKAKTLIGESANWSDASFANPAPSMPTGVTLEPGPGQVSVFAIRPIDEDLQGMVVWMSADPAVPTTEVNRVYQGADNAFMKTQLTPGVPVYFRVAFYDAFGTAGLNVSSSISATPTASGGVPQVTELPVDPAAVGGELAVFLNVAEAELRGLYGWDGEEWVAVGALLDNSVTATKITDNAVIARHVLAGSLTADKLAVTELSAISANLGTMTAGNFTLSATGFIRGGATSFSSGTGFWMGHDGGAYKFRAGVPGSSRFEWTGSAFNIYDATGALTISSGTVNYGLIADRPTSLAAVNSAEGSKLSGIATGATRNVFRGDWQTATSYVVGDIVIHSGYGWSAIAAHTSGPSAMPPVYPTSSNVNWTLYSVKGADGEDGASGLNGTRTAVLDVYRWSAAAPVTFPVGSSTYTWATGQFTLPATPNGWSLTPQLQSKARPFWVARQLYADSATSATSAVAWSASTARPESYAGANGVRTAYLEVYQWAAVAPTTFPSGTSTYTWATGAFTAPSTPAGWSLTPGASVAGQTLWACSVALSNTTTSATDVVTWGTSTAYAIGAAGAAGQSAITAILSNESHAVPALVDGTVVTYEGSGTQIRVYEGATLLSYDGSGLANGTWAVSSSSTNITRGTLTDSGTFCTVGDHSGLGSSEDYAVINYVIAGKTIAGASFTLLKSQTFAKSKAGVDGSAGPAGPAVLITSDRPATFTATDGTLDGGQANVILTASTQGLTSPTFVWTFSGLQTNPTASTTNSQTITAAQFGTAKSAIVTCTVNGTLVDKVTIVRLERSTAAAGATVGATIGTNLSGQITSGNASTFIANAAIGSAQIGSIALVGTSNFSVKSGTSGQRMEMDSRAIKIFDASGVKRVQLGDLTV